MMVFCVFVRYTQSMNPQMTPEIRSALEQHPVGPVRLEGHTDGGPVYLIRLDDMANLQDLIDDRTRNALAEADKDIAIGRIVDWNPVEMKQLGRERSADTSRG